MPSNAEEHDRLNQRIDDLGNRMIEKLEAIHNDVSTIKGSYVTWRSLSMMAVSVVMALMAWFK